MHLELQAVPHNVSLSGCVTGSREARCTRRRREMTLGVAGWAELNQLYWRARRPMGCAEEAPPAETPPGRRFSIMGGEVPIEGELPVDLSRANEVAAHPCHPVEHMVWWIVHQYGLEDR